MTGRTASYGAGKDDILLMKTDSTGREEWNSTFGGPGDDVGLQLLETKDGYVITGRTESEGAGKKAFQLKTDFRGKKLWEKVYGQDSASISVLQAKDGGFVLAGYIESEDSGRDAWLAKTDSSGDMQWSMLLGGPGQDMATSIVQSSDGSYVVACITNSFGAGAEDVWQVKVSMDNAASSTGYPAGNLTGNTDARSVNKYNYNDSPIKPAMDILK